MPPSRNSPGNDSVVFTACFDPAAEQFMGTSVIVSRTVPWHWQQAGANSPIAGPLDDPEGDLEEAVNFFIEPLDQELLALQEVAAVLSCSDRRYLGERYRNADRAALMEQFAGLKLRAGRR